MMRRSRISIKKKIEKKISITNGNNRVVIKHNDDNKITMNKRTNLRGYNEFNKNNNIVINNNLINNGNDCGILLIVFGFDYDRIAPFCVESIRKFSNILIDVHTNIPEHKRNENWKKFNDLNFIEYDLNDSDNRIIKTNLIKYSRFEKTLYIDVDSVVMSADFINPFKLLDDYDICMPNQYNNITIDNIINRFGDNGKTFKNKIMESPNIYSNIINIYGGGVCYFKKNNNNSIFFNDYYNDWCIEKKRDMPSLMYAVQKNINNLKVFDLSVKEYNGTNSTIIRSLHGADVIYNNIKNDFVRRRVNPKTNDWEFFRQGDKNFHKRYKIGFIYDVKGWAFYNMAINIKHQLSKYYDIFLFKSTENIEVSLDIIFTFSPQCQPKNNKNSIIVYGISSHKYYDFFKNKKYVLSNDKKIYNIIDGENKYYIPNGIDLDFFKLDEIKRKNDVINIGLIGSKMREFHKGSGRVDEICNKLISMGYKINNNKLIINSTNSNDILSQKQLKEYYKNIDIFIISSISETGPNPLLEAMSMNIPVISNNVGLVSDIIKNGYNGFIVGSYENVDEYAEICGNLIDNNKLYEKISNNARNGVLNFDWKIISEKYINIIKDIIKYEKLYD